MDWNRLIGCRGVAAFADGTTCLIEVCDIKTVAERRDGALLDCVIEMLPRELCDPDRREQAS